MISSFEKQKETLLIPHNQIYFFLLFSLWSPYLNFKGIGFNIHFTIISLTR